MQIRPTRRAGKPSSLGRQTSSIESARPADRRHTIKTVRTADDGAGDRNSESVPFECGVHAPLGLGGKSFEFY